MSLVERVTKQLRIRVDVAACAPTRKVPSRKPVSHLSSVLKAAVVFECKQVRGDLIRDNKRRALLSERLKTFPGDASEVGFDNYFYSGYQECVIKLSKIKGTDATDALKEIEWAIHADGGERERLDDAIAYQTKL